MTAYELNLDGLVGPTHHYAGLAKGNVASEENALRVANPQAAALQGLAKMRFLHQLGLKQAVVPPHQRPNFALLRQLGFTGTTQQLIDKASAEQPQLLSACFSASSMWAANAATVSASMDTSDGRLHFTAANLISNLHRHQEADFSRQLLLRLFAETAHFVHHEILPRSLVTSDEGAANFSRLCARHEMPGLSLFVYGKKALSSNRVQPQKYLARQTLEASQAIARAHGLTAKNTVFAQQNPRAIDSGVFHNDVIATANESLLLVHESAYVNQQQVYAQLRQKAEFDLNIIEVSENEISLDEAVSSYLFNSQIVTTANQRMALIAPEECRSTPKVKAFIDKLINDNRTPLDTVHYLDVKQSMQNGGGPACLRLRVPLTEPQLQSMHQGVLISEPLLQQLELWVKKHYRTTLHADDLADPQLLVETLTALDELSRILQLGSIYPFQQPG